MSNNFYAQKINEWIKYLMLKYEQDFSDFESSKEIDKALSVLNKNDLKKFAKTMLAEFYGINK